jgi:hypothetical protein
MKLTVTRTPVYAAPIEDRVGGLHEKLAALRSAGANLEFVIARRAPDRPGQGVVFLAPLRGTRQARAATAAGFTPTLSLHSVRIEGADRPGIGAAITEVLLDEGINLRGLSAAAIGKRFVAYLAVDSEPDAVRAVKALRRIS